MDTGCLVTKFRCALRAQMVQFPTGFEEKNQKVLLRATRANTRDEHMLRFKKSFGYPPLLNVILLMVAYVT